LQKLWDEMLLLTCHYLLHFGFRLSYNYRSKNHTFNNIRTKLIQIDQNRGVGYLNDDLPQLTAKVALPTDETIHVFLFHYPTKNSHLTLISASRAVHNETLLIEYVSTYLCLILALQCRSTMKMEIVNT